MGGLGGLSREEKIYFSTTILDNEVNYKGFERYFLHSPANMIYTAIDGLEIIGAHYALDLLLQAKAIVFGGSEPITDCGRRCVYFHQKDFMPTSFFLEPLDREYRKNQRGVREKLIYFAETHKLFDPFKNEG